MNKCKFYMKALLFLIVVWFQFFSPPLVQGKNTIKHAHNEQLIIWDGDKIGLKAQTWANPEGEYPSSTIDVISSLGLSNSASLKWRAKGKNWKGFGLNWYGWYPSNGGDDVSRYKNLVFHVRMEYQGAPPPARLFSVSLISSTTEPKSRESTGNCNFGEYIEHFDDGKWHEVVIPFNDLLGERNLEFDLTKVWEFRIGEWNLDGYDYTLYFDNIGFDSRKVVSLISIPEKRDALPVSKDSVAVSAKLDLSEKGQQVSPYIYGVSFGDPKTMAEMGVTMRRYGGNKTTCYNWKTGNTSLGADWYFLNQAEPGMETPENNWWAIHHRENLKYGIESYMTMPMEWVAKDSVSVGFPGDLYPDCTEFAPNDAEKKQAGNGKIPLRDQNGNIIMENGKIKTRDIRCDEFYPTQNGTNVGVDYNVELVEYSIKHSKFGSAKKKKGIRYICLDNEPMLHISTHRDMVSTGYSYDVYWERTREYAEKIKAVDPHVKISAPGVWGWIAYMYSSGDLDYASKHGIDWDSSKFPDYTK